MKNRFRILTLALVLLLLVIVLPFGGSSSKQKEGYTEFSQLEGKKIGIQVGTGCDDTVFNKLEKADVIQYSTKYDLINALYAGKIEAFVMDEPIIQYLMPSHPRLTYLKEPLDVFYYAYMFSDRAESIPLWEELNAYIRKLKSDGTLKQLEEKWFSEDESLKTMPDIHELTGENGTLKMATDPSSAPMEYLRNAGIVSEIVGYDIEIAIMFAKEYGYGLDIVSMSGDALLSAVNSGAVDFAGSYICVMPERTETVLYSEINFTCNSVMCVLDPETQKTGGNIFTDFGDKFYGTFIRENRWLLFVQGILTTILITLMSAVLGTVGGYAFYRISVNGSPAARKAVNGFVWFIEGIPLVVFLMILYYMIFKALPLGGTMISILCFMLSFSATVYDLLKMGCGTVAKGQYEASYTLGYDEKSTFQKVILPQALPIMIPSFNSAVKELLKGTSIVGYIAVQDLTMMGDIIRGRTYDAVFPLAAVALIYFLLEMAADAVLKRMEAGLEPHSRKESLLLKGVNRHD